MSNQINKSPEFIQDKYIQLLESANLELHKKSKVFTIKNIFVYSSIVAGLLVLLSFIYLDNSTEDIFNNHLTKTALTTDVLLVKDAEGNYYKIPKDETIKWITNDGLFIEINEKELHFTATKTLSNHNYYSLIVPQNRQYKLVLTDGTKIKLNENTTITFVNTRNIEKNNVILQGEAYFEVTHNPAHPFRVQASDIQISVLGTEFNVQNYIQNNKTQVALVNGSVKVGTGNSNTFIVPGQQATIVNNTNNIAISDADFDSILSWTTHQLNFSEKKLSEIVKVVGAWYRVSFYFSDEDMKNIHFTGNIKKQDGLLHFLQILKYTEGINYKINNDTISLSKNNHN